MEKSLNREGKSLNHEDCLNYLGQSCRSCVTSCFGCLLIVPWVLKPIGIEGRNHSTVKEKSLNREDCLNYLGQVHRSCATSCSGCLLVVPWALKPVGLDTTNCGNFCCCFFFGLKFFYLFFLIIYLTTEPSRIPTSHQIRNYWPPANICHLSSLLKSLKLLLPPTPRKVPFSVNASICLSTLCRPLYPLWVFSKDWTVFPSLTPRPPENTKLPPENTPLPHKKCTLWGSINEKKYLFLQSEYLLMPPPPSTLSIR